MNDPNQAPAAEGGFDKTPFAHLVLYLYQHASSGTLVVRAAGGSASSELAVLFQGGRPVAARFPTEESSLANGLLALCSRGSGAFAYYNADLIGSVQGLCTGAVDPLRLVAQAARSHVRRETVDDTLRRYGDSPLRFSPSIDLSRLALTSEEQKLVDLLRAEPSDVMTLAAQSELTPDATRRVLYLLAITRVVAPYQSSASRTTSPGFAVPGSVSASAPRPPATNDATGTTRNSSSSVRRVSMTPPQPGAAAQPSIPPTGKPDSTSSAASRSSSPPAAWQSIAARASASLRPPPGSSQSLAPPSMAPPPGARRSLTPRPSLPPLEALDSDAKFRRAEQLIQRNAFDEALPFVQALVAEEPKVAKHHGILARVLLGQSTERSTVSKDIVDAVNQALRINEDETYALYTKGLCYKRLGKEREALHYFKRAVSVDPGHIEAAREARLLRLRHSEDLVKDKKGKP